MTGHATDPTLFDELTGLPTYALFNDRLQQALYLAQRHPLRVCLMVASLDVADADLERLGDQHREELLREIGRRLDASLRRSDSAGCMGERRFAIMLPHTNEEGVPLVAGRLMVQMLQPVTLPGTEVVVRASVGVTVCGDQREHQEAPAELFDQALAAMRAARAKGGGFEAWASAEAREFVEAMRLG